MEFQTSGVTENRESYVILIINTGVVVKHETCTAADLSTKNKCYNILKLPPFLWPFLNTILVFRRNTFLVEGIEDLLAQSLRTWVQWMYITVYNINNRPLVPNIQQKIVYLLLSTITVIRIVQDLSDIERSGQELQDSSAPLSYSRTPQSTVHSRRSRYPYIFNKIFPVWKCVHKYAILFKTAHTFINYMKSVDKMMCDYIQ